MLKFLINLLLYTVPNGEQIYIYAQKEISDEQLLRVYAILGSYLDFKDGTKYASLKDEIANRVAREGQFIAMLKGHDGQYEIEVDGQPLYQKETPLDGSKAYLINNYYYRDAAFEEILHFVHDNGIGTKYTDGVLKKTWQRELGLATTHALENELWGIGGDEIEDWLEELEEEGSLTQEYLAAVVDSYYGLWANWQETAGGMWGIYIAKNRKEIRRKDPQGWNVLVQYFPEYLGYMSRISKDFEGTFSLTLNSQISYTYKSQYLLNARLTGSNSAHLLGNAQNNILIGNKGSNTLNGLEGTDTVQVMGLRENYLVKQTSSNTWTITEKQNPQHIDTLIHIERLVFQDQTILLAQEVQD